MSARGTRKARWTSRVFENPRRNGSAYRARPVVEGFVGDPVVVVVSPESGVCRCSALGRLESPKLVVPRTQIVGWRLELGSEPPTA